jgi:hypothetical protein
MQGGPSKTASRTWRANDESPRVEAGGARHGCGAAAANGGATKFEEYWGLRAIRPHCLSLLIQGLQDGEDPSVVETCGSLDKRRSWKNYR